MIRIVLTTLFSVYVGVLLGEISVGKDRLGHTALTQCRQAWNWSGAQLKSLVNYAGVGNTAVTNWIPKVLPKKEKLKEIDSEPPDQDPEGLTQEDRQALREILESP